MGSVSELDDPAAELMRAALDAVEREDWDKAAAGFGKAADAFLRAGRTRMAQRARLGQANSLSETGALRKAATLLDELRASVPVEDDLWLSATANLAVCRARGGDLDGAENLWQVCFARYLDSGQPAEAATCLHNAALSLHERGRELDALRLAGGARSILAQADGTPAELIAECDSTAGMILSSLGEYEAARAALTEAADAFSAAGRRLDEGRCHGNLAIVSLAEGDVAGARRHADVAVDALEATGSPATRLAVASLLTALAVAGHDLREGLRLSRDALEQASQSGSALDLADALHNLAVLEARAGDRHAAFRHALDAFNVIDRYRYSVDSLVDRHFLTVARFEPMLLHVLELAHVTATPEDTAVLIERARVAGTPQGDTQPDAIYGSLTPNPPPKLAGDGPLSRDLKLPVVFPGELQLQPSSPGSGRQPVTYLSDLICSSARPTAWWWGTWAQRGRLHWVVRTPRGQVHTGVATVSAEVLDLARTLTPVPSRSDMTIAAGLARDPAVAASWSQLAALARMLSGPMAFDPVTARTLNETLPARLRATADTRPAIGFEEAMLRLGEAILPPPLVELADPGAQREPARLAVSIAPGLSWLPLPLLAAVTVGGQVQHLVEFATISLSPPWPVARQLAQAEQRERTTAPARVGLSIADPLGDLRHVRSRAIGAERTLGYSTDGSRAPATLDGIRAAASGLTTDAMLVYQGHVELADPSEPLSASLVLPGQAGSGGQRKYLSAYQVLTDPERWSFPHTVLLDGCETTGVWGSAEWGGLVPAMLRRGARQVISTLWPVLDAPDAAALTQQLVGAMLDAGDAAAAVSRVQRDLLAGWRAGRSSVTPHHFGAHVATGSFARD